jgi:hypothetical protein
METHVDELAYMRQIEQDVQALQACVRSDSDAAWLVLQLKRKVNERIVELLEQETTHANT